ncbi:MAG: N-6 DNA methylase [Melioribacteraceae bacterium]|nr:N-6 DNA methylase [Melioribacteraceae bacterium]
MTTKDLKKLEDLLWQSADNLRANSDLSSNEYSLPVLGLIFLRFADNQYSKYESEIIEEFNSRKDKSNRKTEKSIDKIAIEKCGLYLPDEARYDYLLNLPSSEDIDKAIKNAMTLIEKYVVSLEGVLPKDEYFKLTRTNKELPKELLRNFSNIPKDASGDVLGQIYEYFLSKFALAEGQGGGEFFTPKSVVRLMVEIIEPHGGAVYDPACGSGGMFVQSVRFIEEHNKINNSNSLTDVFVYGQEKNGPTVNLAKMNLAVNNLRGTIYQANTYYNDLPDKSSYSRFDYVLANPPFNVDDVNLKEIENQKRFNEYGIPRNKTKTKKKDAGKETIPNANYLWINLFATSLNEKGRAALVMANSASDARNSEADIRKKLIESNIIYGMITLPSNMFYTVTLPATLWFFNKSKKDEKILFIDARNVFTQIDRAHREFSDEQIHNLSLISRLHQGKNEDYINAIHNYFNKAFAEVESLKTAIVNNHSLFENFIKTFSAWYIQPSVESAFQTNLKEFKETEINSPSTSNNQFLVKDFSELKQIVDSLKSISITNEIKSIEKLELAFNQYNSSINLNEITLTNKEQIKLYKIFNKVEEELNTLYKSFNKLFHIIEELYKYSDKNLKEKNDKLWKDITPPKELNLNLSEFHDRINPSYLRESQFLEKSYAYFVHNINWLQSRFPNASYEDVTGLCKLASISEIKEQDYSLNPGRYVGVVIEEDGMTEEEFFQELKQQNELLNSLNKEAATLQNIIDSNIMSVINNE